MTQKLKAGDWVQSHYKATWKGVIQGIGHVDNCFYVLALIDQHNNPIRKPMIKYLNQYWLTAIDPPANAKDLLIKIPHHKTLEMSKYMKGTIYKSPPIEGHPKGQRWYFVEHYPKSKDWMMARVSDGHRLFVNPRRLVIE